MSRSLSLAAYLAYARRSSQPQNIPDIPRPKGELIWAHAVDSIRADALVQLTERLVQQRPGVQMLLTTKGDVSSPSRTSDAVIWQPLPDDTVDSAEVFLGHWSPDVCLWTGGDLQPAFLIQADQRGVPLYLIDAEETLLDRPGWRWFPDLPRSVLRLFTAIMVRTENTARYLRRLGIRDDDILVTGPFLGGAMALPYTESDREKLAEILRGRPIWLAAMLQLNELEVVLTAHRDVSKLAHRTLLVIVPNDINQSQEMQEQLDLEGWRYVIWSEGQIPDESTQVLLADTRGEMGLWYRLAPITFMASSLCPGQSGCDPNEPAAHGSAILYGPNIKQYLSNYSRYAEAGAARIVRDTETLAAAVRRLIAPDQSALMAHAAWDVASQGAAVTDRILDTVQDTLDVTVARS